MDCYTLHRVGRVLSFFSSRRNWDSPNPSPARLRPPPFGSGGSGTFDGERGGGRFPIATRGHTLWYSVYLRVCTLWIARSGTEKIRIRHSGKKPTLITPSLELAPTPPSPHSERPPFWPLFLFLYRVTGRGLQMLAGRREGRNMEPNPT
jgi:hypothetical protein